MKTEREKGSNGFSGKRDENFQARRYWVFSEDFVTVKQLFERHWEPILFQRSNKARFCFTRKFFCLSESTIVLFSFLFLLVH